MLSSPFRGTTRMRRLTLALFALGLVTAVAQFIPDKSVVIHPSVESQPERGATEGPGTGLGTTPPTPLAARGGTRVARSGGPLARRLLQTHQHERRPAAGCDHAEARL